MIYLHYYLGGPGPEIAISVDLISPDTLISLTVIVTTESGQTINSTVTLTPEGLYWYTICFDLFYSFFFFIFPRY